MKTEIVAAQIAVSNYLKRIVKEEHPHEECLHVSACVPAVSVGKIAVVSVKLPRHGHNHLVKECAENGFPYS